MSKALEEVKTLRGFNQVELNNDENINKSLDIIEDELKVLEILKEKQVDVNLFITIIPFNKSIEELTRAYNQCFIERCRLTIEETTLLKRYFNE